METSIRFENDVSAFMTQVKTLKNLAKGKSPAKSPGSYSPNVIITGRDGNEWEKVRVYHIDTSDGYIDERYELVWKKITTV